ncbi:MAG TPA: glycine/sarcosine/betaine reductase component B subunit [Candidatus Polarisedimenticolaceae bacterium]|nr:glycine/sarcosine/betaine reductase component B subunit [Candidatus Polarisedimenticolaceae bacterium]
MELTLEIHPITAIRFGHSTSLDGTTLVIDADRLRALLLEDQTLTAVDLAIACPGESCRAGPVFDIVEPRAKAPNSSPDFPGILGPPYTAGLGTTHVLEGAAVTVLRENSPGDSRGATGYVLEMSGEAAAGSKYSSLQHLIIVPQTQSRLPDHARHKAYRLAGLKAAVYLARAAFNHTPASRLTLDLLDGIARERDGLPRVAYVGQIFSRQRKPELDERILYGLGTDGMLPVPLHPDEWLDGALLPSYHTSLGGAETYFYQNHPVITELYRRHHARELNFAGTVATIASADNFDRERNCRFAANLVQMVLKAEAAILTKFGGGVPHTDLSETARLLEAVGIKTAVQVTDLARDRRMESALLFNFPEVNAIVCIGGNSTSWKVPRVEQVIATSAELKEVLAGPLHLDSLNVVGVANQQGASRLRAMVY